MEEDQWIIVFNSTHQVLRGEKILKKKKIKAEVIPLPRIFTVDGAAECGLALQIGGSLINAAEKVLTAFKVDYKGIYEVKET